MAGWAGRAWAALRGRDARAPDWAADRGRILLVGPTGAGKSALVNAVLGEAGHAAVSAAGAPVTAGTAWHGRRSRLPLALGDTRGLEAAESRAQVAALDAALAAMPPARRPHLAWLVVNAETARAFDGPGTLAAFAASLRRIGIPSLVVLTHAEPGEDAHPGLRARFRETMDDPTIVGVNTIPLRGEDGTELMPAHGLDALLAASRAFLPLS